MVEESQKVMRESKATAEGWSRLRAKIDGMEQLMVND